MSDTTPSPQLANIYRSLNKSPAALGAVQRSQDCLETTGQLNDAERAVIGLCVSAWDKCDYCCQAHGSLARRNGVEMDEIAALINHENPTDARLHIVAQATTLLLQSRGKIGAARRRDLIAQGLGESELVEIIALIGLYTMATFTANLDNTPVDPDLRAFSPEELARFQDD